MSIAEEESGGEGVACTKAGWMHTRNVILTCVTQVECVRHDC
jgi:hypothetical protein